MTTETISAAPIPATAAPPEPIDDQAAAALLVSAYRQITDEMGKFIVGQDSVIEQLVIAVLAGGHCLLEG
ncbi:MAG: AAA family ATPase, partial [Chthoniobacteraceae bacterium]